MTGQASPSRALVPTLALVTTITAMVSSLGAPLVPSIADEYGVAIATAQWSLTAALLTGATTTPVLGRLASGRARKGGMLLGLALVALGALTSTVAATRPSAALAFEALIAGRALQGVGMALLPLAIAVARDELAGVAMVRSIALLSVTTVAGAGLGYPVTALVAEATGLAGAFFLGLAMTGATLAMTAFHVPMGAARPRQTVDWVGAALLVGALLPLLLAVTQGALWGWTASPTIMLACLGATFLPAWAAWSLRCRAPLVDLRLAWRPGLAAPNLVALVAGIGMYCLLTLAVLLVRAEGTDFGLGHGVAVAGLILVPYSLASVVGNRWTQRAAAGLAAPALLPLGCLMFLLASAFLAVFHDQLWQALLAMALGGVGSGFTFSSLAALMVPHVPQLETASAVAFNQVLRYLGFTVGSAISPVLVGLFGGGERGFQLTLATMCALWVFAGVGVAVLDRRQAP